MTTPESPTRPLPTGRRFDLRATAMFFGLAAVGLCVAGWAVRTAFDVADRRPVWAVLLGSGAVLAVVLRRRRSSGLAGWALARRTTDVLEKATATALEALEEEAAAGCVTVVDEPLPAVAVDHATLGPDRLGQATAGLCCERHDRGSDVGPEESWR
ncbi:hypothetical protein ACGFZL_23720 [Streptomyces sp. NPDC048182]|uniref:hypothetical protein n=1 Tax=Streptomyces sp. NPDC048182 TaxID=3365507 RepID=UPI0037111268